MNIRQDRDVVTDRAANIEKLAELIRDVEVAMLTTVSPDGQLASRPMGTQQVEFDGDLWFAAGCYSGKAAEILARPNVNVAYASPAKVWPIRREPTTTPPRRISEPLAWSGMAAWAMPVMASG